MTTEEKPQDATPRRLLYCHCAFARVVPQEVKNGVLQGLAESNVAFEAVPDLCALAAHKDPSLLRLANGDSPLEIVACYPRAVRWLFHAADAPLPEDGVRIHNMRTQDAATTLNDVFAPAPNLPVEAAAPTGHLEESR